MHFNWIKALNMVKKGQIMNLNYSSLDYLILRTVFLSTSKFLNQIIPFVVFPMWTTPKLKTYGLPESSSQPMLISHTGPSPSFRRWNRIWAWDYTWDVFRLPVFSGLTFPIPSGMRDTLFSNSLNLVFVFWVVVSVSINILMLIIQVSMQNQ